jgi:maltose alpha-D-glucosyltransferase/alpha-amylase
MQWTDEANGGFSTAPARELIRPVIAEGEFGYSSVNVAAQHRDPGSLLSWMQRTLRVRRGCREFARGECEFLATGTREVLAHRCTDGDRSVVAVHNLSPTAQTVDLPQRPASKTNDLLTRDDPAVRDGCIRVALPPFGYRWFRETPDDGTARRA